jgi:hypothetical protein
MLAQATGSLFVISNPNTGPRFDLDLNTKNLAAAGDEFVGPFFQRRRSGSPAIGMPNLPGS